MTDRHAGALYAVAAFAFWGLTPIYWKQLQEVSALQLLGHRIAWSLPCLLILLLGRRKVPELREVLRNSRVRWVLLGTTVLIATNWLTFIWAVNSGRILEASLGYYINPLMNVGLGALLLGERPSRAQGWAVLLAVGGVALMAWRVGGVPWPALVLALSFGLYGLVRKLVPAGALVGLTSRSRCSFPLWSPGLCGQKPRAKGPFFPGIFAPDFC